MASDNLDAADLRNVAADGLINESVMQKIWDISNIPLPFSDMAPQDGDVTNAYHSWTQDRLAPPNTDNAKVDGADTIGDDDTSTGKRVGNHAQISTKTVKVSTRAREVDTIGFSDTLSYQVMERQKELRRDVEATHLTGQASVEDDGNATPGRTGALAAWLETTVVGGAGFAVGGFNTSTKVVDAYTPGAARALTEKEVRDQTQAIYELGGDPDVMMCVPGVIRQFSEYLFTSSARIATMQSDVGQQPSSKTAIGSVNVFVSDFGSTLRLTPNRLQQTHVDAVATQVADAFYLDMELLAQGYVHGYRVEPLSKTGLADKRQMAVDHMLIVKNEEGLGMSADIDPTLPVTQS